MRAKTRGQLERELSDREFKDRIIEEGHRIWAKKIVEQIVFGAVTVILLGFLGYLVALTWPK